MTKVIGVDLGISGAIGAIDLESGAFLFVNDMPVVQTVSGKKKRDVYDFPMICYGMEDMVGEGDFVICEKSQPMPPGSTSQANHGLGLCHGLFVGILFSMKARHEFVKPKEWQKHFRISNLKNDDTKVQSYQIASSLFPEAILKGPRGGIKDGRCDALLLAEYARRRLVGEVI